MTFDHRDDHDPEVIAERDRLIDGHVYGDLKPITRLWRRIVGGICLPFLAGLGWIATEFSGSPDGGDNKLARAMAWAIEPFRKPDPKELAARDAAAGS